VGWLDSALYRHPFEGASARRYERAERPAFGDLDDRLLDRMAVLLAGARRLLDLGSGPGTFAARAAARHPGLTVVAVEPSRDFVSPGMVRARGEELPFAAGVIDVAICLSSIRHVRDRAATLRELRRVLRPGGTIRLAVPDLDRAITAYREGNPGYFYVPDRDVRSIGGKLSVQMTWYGSTR